MTNTEIIEAVRRWQSDPYLHPLTCQSDVGHGRLAPVEVDGSVVLTCPACPYHERVIPDVVLQVKGRSDSRS